MALLERTRDLENIPEDHGIRLDGQSDETGLTAIRLTWAEEPQSSDQVIDNGDAIDLYIDADVAPALADVMIDVSEDSSQLILRKSPDGPA